MSKKSDRVRNRLQSWGETVKDRAPSGVSERVDTEVGILIHEVWCRPWVKLEDGDEIASKLDEFKSLARDGEKEAAADVSEQLQGLMQHKQQTWPRRKQQQLRNRLERVTDVAASLNVDADGLSGSELLRKLRTYRKKAENGDLDGVK